MLLQHVVLDALHCSLSDQQVQALTIERSHISARNFAAGFCIICVYLIYLHMARIESEA